MTISEVCDFAIHNSPHDVRRTTIAFHAKNAQPVRCILSSVRFLKPSEHTDAASILSAVFSSACETRDPLTIR